MTQSTAIPPIRIDRHEFSGDMLIGLVSDTHIPEARRTIFDEVYAAMRGVDLILHAGDMHDSIVIDWLEEVAPVLAARGNGDDGSSGLGATVRRRVLPGCRSNMRLVEALLFLNACQT